MNLDPRKALAYSQRLARPRLVGSGEDARVTAELAEQFRGWGYSVDLETFQFSRAFDIALAVEIAIALILTVVSLVVPAWRPFCGACLLIVVSAAPPVNTRIQSAAVAPDSMDPAQARFLRWGRLFKAANVVARNPGSEEQRRSKVYLVAHLDSKSQRMPIVARVGLFTGLLIGLYAFGLASLLRLSGGDGFTLGAAGLALVCGLPLLWLDVGNESPGAIDNASGAGLVLHLAELLAADGRLAANLDVTFMITSAEEMATMGALFHARLHRSDLNRSGAVIINLDGVGIDGRVFMAGGGRRAGGLTTRFFSAARTMRIRLGRFALPGLLFDHVPFADCGLDAVSLLVIGPNTQAVHTARDTADKLDASGFERVGGLVLRVLEGLAQ